MIGLKRVRLLEAPKKEIGRVLPKAPERRGQDNHLFHKIDYYSSIIFIFIFFGNLYYIIIFICLPVVCCIYLLMFLYLTYKVWSEIGPEISLNLRIFQKTASLFNCFMVHFSRSFFFFFFFTLFFFLTNEYSPRRNVFLD